MEFEGVVYKIMPVTRGTSARGEWQRQDVVFDYNDGGQFSRKICVTFFNKESDVAKLREGEDLPRVGQHRVARIQRPLVHRHPRLARAAQAAATAGSDDRCAAAVGYSRRRRFVRRRCRRRGGRPAVLSGRGGIYNGRRAEFSSNSARRPFRVPLRQFVRRVGMRAAVISLSCCRRYRMSRQSPSFRRCCSGSRP